MNNKKKFKNRYTFIYIIGIIVAIFFAIGVSILVLLFMPISFSYIFLSFLKILPRIWKNTNYLRMLFSIHFFY